MANPASGNTWKKAPVKSFRLLRGQYTRREFENDSDSVGKFVHYIAGQKDVLTLSEDEVNKLGRRYLLEVSEGGIEKPTPEQTAYISNMEKIKAKLDEKADSNSGWGQPAA